MRRLYEAPAYGPQRGCFWAETVQEPPRPALGAPHATEVAIIGGGFTGLSAALHLAQAGIGVSVFEAQEIGWGASGRNGGFCCLGGAKAPGKLIAARFGAQGLADWHATEKAAVETVADLLNTHGIEADRHSAGETQIAHTPRAMDALRAGAAEIRADYGVAPEIIAPEELRAHGLGGPFHGAMTIPLGFALNPRKYLAGLARAAEAAGAEIFAQSPVTRIDAREGRIELVANGHAVRCDRVIVATNGYSSEDVPDWLRGRTLPVQSSVIVTRPLSRGELEAQGWTSTQMAYDTRTLLHYFRKLPDDRFLFGMRGGLRATPGAEAGIARKIRRDFQAMFPAWRGVEITHGWSGLVCLMANLTPFAGPVPGMPGVFAGLGYHGNGVAMGTQTGRILAALARGAVPDTPYPEVMQAPPKRFPLGRFRRALLAPAYAAASLLDR